MGWKLCILKFFMAVIQIFSPKVLSMNSIRINIPAPSFPHILPTMGATNPYHGNRLRFRDCLLIKDSCKLKWLQVTELETGCKWLLHGLLGEVFGPRVKGDYPGAWDEESRLYPQTSKTKALHEVWACGGNRAAERWQIPSFWLRASLVLETGWGANLYRKQDGD